MESPAPQEFCGYPVTQVLYRFGDHPIDLIGPANHEALIDDPETARRFGLNEYLPYWATIWPVCIAFAHEVARWPAPAGDARSVVELGCGLGLISVLLGKLGFDVLATDYDRDALAFVEENARRNGVERVSTQFYDWQRSELDGGFDRIVAADVLYETRNLRPVAEFVQEYLNPGGRAFIADPNRFTADDFETIVRHSGLRVSTMPLHHAVATIERPVQGRLFVIEHAAPDGPASTDA